MPSVDTGDEAYRWRSVWVYDVTAQTVRQVSPGEVNIWECAWCGNDAIAAVISPGPGEGLWYGAHLAVIDIATAAHREVYKPTDQLGCPAADPSGKYLAVVEALCRG